MAKLTNKTKRRIYTAAIWILSGILAVCVGLLIWHTVKANQSQELYGELQSIVDSARPSVTRPAPTEPPSTSDPTEPQPTAPSETVPQATEPESPWVEVTDPETGETVLVLPEYAQLYAMNSDMVGWLEIPGSDIRYPVMQTPDNPDYYLSHAFDKSYAPSGCLYAKEAADVFAPSDNVTIYGHRTADDTMFNQLLRYRDVEYYRQYPYIYFDTLTERHTYEIAYVFITTTTIGQGFAYHNFVNAVDEYAFYRYVDGCRANAIYDTGIQVTYGDKLITLSTCEYSQPNGRFVIVAKRVS